MSEKQKLITALHSVSETSVAALAFLANPPESVTVSSLGEPSLSLLHKDFLSLLSLIYASTTKLSLTLKPSSPSYKAALEPLKELSDRAASLPYCVRLLQIDYGKTLGEEVNAIAKSVLEALDSLVQSFIALNSEKTSSGEAGSQYLVKTGTVHDIIDKARGHDGFSRDNLAAVRKVLQRNQGSLDDGLAEICGTMENVEKHGVGGEEEDEEEEDFDDGWAELGFSSSKTKPSVAEIERIKKMYAIVRLSNLLHQRIFKDVLPSLSLPLPLSKEANTIIDDLADASSEFLAFSDNFISTMYPPQSTEQISTELGEYQRQITHFQTKIDPFIPEPPVEEQLQNLQLYNTAKSPDQYTKLRRWFIACINQVNKNIHELEDELKRST